MAWSFVALLNFVVLLFTLSRVPDRNYWVLLGGPMAVLYGMLLYRTRQQDEPDGSARADTKRAA